MGGVAAKSSMEATGTVVLDVDAGVEGALVVELVDFDPEPQEATTSSEALAMPASNWCLVIGSLRRSVMNLS